MGAYTTHNGKRVSIAHYHVLRAYELRYHPIFINQGARTIAEQWRFWNIYRRYGHPVAAYPAPNAPHIKWGRQHHAIDMNSPYPAHNIADYYRSQNIPVAFNVRSEAWHMDTLNESALIRAANRLKGVDESLPIIAPGAVGRKVLKLKHAMWKKGLRKFKMRVPVYGPTAVAAIKRLQHAHRLRPDGIVGPATWKALLS